MHHAEDLAARLRRAPLHRLAGEGHFAIPRTSTPFDSLLAAALTDAARRQRDLITEFRSGVGLRGRAIVRAIWSQSWITSRVAAGAPAEGSIHQAEFPTT